jgi:hypothetical protein
MMHPATHAATAAVSMHHAIPAPPFPVLIFMPCSVSLPVFVSVHYSVFLFVLMPLAVMPVPFVSAGVLAALPAAFALLQAAAIQQAVR